MKRLVGQAGAIHSIPLLLIVVAVGVISYLLISSTAPFKAGIFNETNPKPASQAAVAVITTPLKQSTINPNWFVDGNGKPVFLTGSHTWNNFQDWGNNDAIQTFDFNAFVNILSSHNHNFTLLWNTELPHICNFNSGSVNSFDTTPQPWMRTGPGTATDGKPKFDLTKYNQSFFDRMRSRVQQLNSTGIYAGVYLFSAEWLEVFRCSVDGFPFTGANNINGIDDGGGDASIRMSAPNSITAIQDAYVNQLIDTLNDLPNVLWIVSEEGGGQWWNEHMIEHTKTYELTKPSQHPVGLAVSNDWNDATEYNSNADWVAPISKISPSSTCGSGTPRCKVNINDSDHAYYQLWLDSDQTQRNYFWENLTQGNSVMFMDPFVTYWPRDSRNLCINPVAGICSAPDPRWEKNRTTMGYLKSYAERMNLLVMHASSISSTSWALANNSDIGFEALIYQPTSGAFTVNLSATRRSLNVEWFNPDTGVKILAGTVTGGSVSQNFTPPFSGDAVLYLRDSMLSPTPGTCPKAALGDTDCNGLIDIFDFNTIVTNYNKTGVGVLGGDLDNSGKVDIFDFNALVTNFGH